MSSSKVKFNYYLHDRATQYELAEMVHEQIVAHTDMNIDELAELIGRPFYEVQLKCELDLKTGKVEILNSDQTFK